MGDEQVCLHGDLNQFFQSALDDVLRGQQRPPSPIIQSYLVGVLVDSARSEALVSSGLGEPLPLRLQAALTAAPSERFEKLRGLGDSVLLVHGFFHEHTGHLGVEPRYVETLGARAYRSASALLAHGDSPTQGDLLLELAEEFGRLAAILRDVAATLLADAAHGAVQLVRLCEQWLRGGSEHVQRLLLARGVRVAPGRLLVN